MSKAYCSKANIERHQKKRETFDPLVERRRTRADTIAFDLKKSCLLCGLVTDELKSHKKRI